MSDSEYSLISLFENSENSFIFIDPNKEKSGTSTPTSECSTKSNSPKETLQDIINSLKIAKPERKYKMIINCRGRKEIVPILQDGDEYESGEEIDEIAEDDYESRGYYGYGYRNGPDDVYQ